MTLVSRTFETDEFYQFDVVHVGKRCLDFLNLYPSFPEDISCFNSFFSILEEMEHETPFRASHPLREDWSIKDRFYYRRPVWQALFEVTNSLKSKQFYDQKASASFLKEQLHLLHRYLKFVDWMQRSRRESWLNGLTVSFAGQVADVSVNPDLEKIGYNAEQFLNKFFKKALEKLEEKK